MSNESLQGVYEHIFDLKPRDFKIEAVKPVGKTENQSGEDVYHFVAILTAPAQVKNLKVDKDSIAELVKNARTSQADLGGPDVILQVWWEYFDKKRKKKRKRKFHYTAHISPEHLLDFEVLNGKYYLKVEAYGIFY